MNKRIFTDKIYIPTFNSSLFQRESREPIRKLEIRPGTVSYEFEIKCPRCSVWLTVNKKDVSDNHSFTCSQIMTNMPDGICGYTFCISSMPDDIKEFIGNVEAKNVNQRPRIVRR